MPIPTPEQIFAEYQALDGQRSNFANEWELIRRNMMPTKKGITTHDYPGTPQTTEIFDSTGTAAIITMANFLQGNIFNRATRWFNLKFREAELNNDPMSSAWLDDCRTRMLQELGQSNFYSASLEWLTDLIAFGNSNMLIEPTRAGSSSRSQLCFTTMALGSFWWAENDGGEISATYHKIDAKLRNCVQRWGEKMPDTLRDKSKTKPYEDVQLLHAIYPRTWADNKKVQTSLNMPYVSDWILLTGAKKRLEESGYPSYPCAAGRWSPIAGEVYARGPGEVARPDVTTLNHAVDMSLLGWEKFLDPPMVREAGSIVGKIDFNAGKITVVRNLAKKPMPLMDQGTKWDVHQYNLEDKRRQIKEHFFVDEIRKLISVEGPQPPKTAFEVSAQLKLLYQIIAPVSGRIEDGVRRMIDTTFEIMFRKGMFARVTPAMPKLFQLASTKSLQLEIEYEGPLAKSQRASELQSIRDFLNDVAMLGQLDQNAMLVLDAVAAARLSAQYNGVELITRDTKSVDALAQRDNMIKELQTKLAGLEQVTKSIGNAAPMVQALNQPQKKAA